MYKTGEICTRKIMHAHRHKQKFTFLVRLSNRNTVVLNENRRDLCIHFFKKNVSTFK